MINQEEMDPKDIEQAAGAEKTQNVEETTPVEATVESPSEEESKDDDVIIVEGESSKSLVQVQNKLKGDDVLPEESTHVALSREIVFVCGK